MQTEWVNASHGDSRSHPPRFRGVQFRFQRCDDAGPRPDGRTIPRRAARREDLRRSGPQPCRYPGRVSAVTARGWPSQAGVAELPVLRHIGSERARRAFVGARCRVDHVFAHHVAGGSRCAQGARRDGRSHPRIGVSGSAGADRGNGVGQAVVFAICSGSRVAAVRRLLPKRSPNAGAPSDLPSQHRRNERDSILQIRRISGERSRTERRGRRFTERRHGADPDPLAGISATGRLPVRSFRRDGLPLSRRADRPSARPTS